MQNNLYTCTYIYIYMHIFFHIGRKAVSFSGFRVAITIFWLHDLVSYVGLLRSGGSRIHHKLITVSYLHVIGTVGMQNINGAYDEMGDIR